MDRQASPWVVQPLVIASDDMHVHLEDDVLVLAKEVGVSRQSVPLPVTLCRQMCMRFDTKSARSHTPTLGSVPGEGGRPADDQPVRTALHASRSDGIPMAFRWQPCRTARTESPLAFSDRRRRNVSLSGGRNATLQMRRADYSDPTKYIHSEFRMGLWLIDSVDIKVDNLRISDTGGDGRTYILKTPI